MVAGMSSSHSQRNPHRTRCTILEVPSELNKPVSGDKASILHIKGTTVSQELNSAESHGQRKTKEEKPQATNQNALPDLSACLQKSAHQLNGLVSSKSHELELMVPQKITTPKRPSETSKISHKGRKKKVIQHSEKEVAASKACSDGLDHSEHNSCPEQHLRSQKRKGHIIGTLKKLKTIRPPLMFLQGFTHVLHLLFISQSSPPATLTVIVALYHAPRNGAGPGPGLSSAPHQPQTSNPYLQKELRIVVHNIVIRMPKTPVE